MSTVDTQLLAELPSADQSSATNSTFLQLAVAALGNILGTAEVIQKKYITLDEVSYHDTYKDCWIVLYDRVYDITKFLELVSPPKNY